MNFLDKLPPDKSHHLIGGAMVAAVAASLCMRLAPAWSAHAAVATAAAFGLAKEGADAWVNWRATGSWLGSPRGTPHGVEALDALATAAGGVLVALPLFTAWLMVRGGA